MQVVTHVARPDVSRQRELAAILADIGHAPIKTYSLFDRDLGNDGKEHGIARAVETRTHLVLVARQIAIELEERDPGGGLTVDDVVESMTMRGYDPHSLQNAAVGVFRYKHSPWVHTGEYRASTRPYAHANRLMVWVRKGRR